MRNESIVRQWRILRFLLDELDGISVAQLSKRLKAGERTIYRDLQALQHARFKLRRVTYDRYAYWVLDDDDEHAARLMRARKQSSNAAKKN